MQHHRTHPNEKRYGRQFLESVAAYTEFVRATVRTKTFRETFNIATATAAGLVHADRKMDRMMREAM